MENRMMVEKLTVQIYNGRQALGTAAARAIAETMRNLLARQKTLRMIFAAAPSQDETLAELIRQPNLDWQKVTAFHMDEYLGLSADAPQLFGRYLAEHIFGRVSFAQIHYLNPTATDPLKECQRYASLLRQAPIDIVCMGIGENGHVAFNDPPYADFNDPQAVKVVDLEYPSRLQQVHDGCFSAIDQVPKTAITLTIPTLLSATFQFVMVPGPSKAQAVYRTLTGAVAPSCPASALRRCEKAILFLDSDSSALLSDRQAD